MNLKNLAETNSFPLNIKFLKTHYSLVINLKNQMIQPIKV
jgi:hypothetical protein